MPRPPHRSFVTRRILDLSPEELRRLIEEEGEALGEEETLAILEHPYSTPQLVAKIANQPRLTSFYSVRARLVAHRHTPRGQALKFVHYLYWSDLVRLSTNVHIPPAVRRAIDTNLGTRVGQLSTGEKMTMARICSRELIRTLLHDPSARVLTALLTNPRLTEEDLVPALVSESFNAEKIRVLADDQKWSRRYAVRHAIARHPQTPAVVAASQLRHLRRNHLEEIAGDGEMPLFVRRCAERLKS